MEGTQSVDDAIAGCQTVACTMLWSKMEDLGEKKKRQLQIKHMLWGGQ